MRLAKVTTSIFRSSLRGRLVYNMLITGFDAPRLKKLYMGRVVKRHNLLQGIFERARELNRQNDLLRENVDQKILRNSRLLDNEKYFKQDLTRTVVEEFNRNQIHITADICKQVST